MSVGKGVGREEECTDGVGCCFGGPALGETLTEEGDFVEMFTAEGDAGHCFYQLLVHQHIALTGI